MAVECHEVVVSGGLAGQFTQCVLHWKGSAPDDDLEYPRSLALLTELNQSPGFIDLWTMATPADYTVTSLRCKRVWPDGGPTAILTRGVLEQSVGQRAGEIQAAQVSPCVIWIPLEDSSKTGRTFIPGVSEDDLDQGSFIGSFITAVDDLISFMVTPLGAVGTFTGDVEFCLYRRAKTTPTPVAASVDIVPYGRLSPVVGTQRRRLRPM